MYAEKSITALHTVVMSQEALELVEQRERQRKAEQAAYLLWFDDGVERRHVYLGTVSTWVDIFQLVESYTGLATDHVYVDASRWLLVLKKTLARYVFVREDHTIQVRINSTSKNGMLPLNCSDAVVPKGAATHSGRKAAYARIAFPCM